MVPDLAPRIKEVIARCMLAKKYGVQVGSSETFWLDDHVYDRSKSFLKIAEEAVHGGVGAKWGKEGYSLTENGEHVWGKVPKR